jgi:phospholipid transport system transporter-binding protein
MPGTSTSRQTTASARAVNGVDSFAATASGCYRLQAPLQFTTVARLRAQGLELIASAQGELTVDLSAVPAVDSAGLALLIEWLARARAGGMRLRYQQAPAALLALARLSEVEPLLGAQNG